MEATRDDLAVKNRLCPPNRQPDVPLDWVRGTFIGMKADNRWSKEPDLAEWLDCARLNTARGLRQRSGDPLVQQAWMRYAEHVRAALAKLEQFGARA